MTTNGASAASFLHTAKIIELDKRKEKKYDVPFSKNLKSDVEWEVWGGWLIRKLCKNKNNRNKIHRQHWLSVQRL